MKIYLILEYRDEAETGNDAQQTVMELLDESDDPISAEVDDVIAVDLGE